MELLKQKLKTKKYQYLYLTEILNKQYYSSSFYEEIGCMEEEKTSKMWMKNFDWLEKLIEEYDRILKNNSNLFLFSGRQYNRYLNLILDKYFIEKRIIIWARKRMYNSTRGNALSSGYEPISFYSKGDNPIFNKIKVLPTREDLRKRYEKHSYLKDGVALSDVWDDIPALPYNSKEKLNHS